MISFGSYQLIIVNQNLGYGVTTIEHLLDEYVTNYGDTENIPIALLTFLLDKEVNVAIYEGMTQKTLEYGAARISGSANISENGNTVLYGHRDSAFSVLEKIKVGDRVKIKTKEKEIYYTVTKSYVTTPDDTDIFETTLEKRLTLVTCYPFILVGPANDRYILELKAE